MYPCWFMVIRGSRCVPGHEECSFKSGPTPHSYTVSGPSYNLFLFRFFSFFYYYFFPFFFIYFFYNGLLRNAYTKGNMMIRQLMFFGRKKFGLPLFFHPHVLYTQPVSQHSFDLRCVIIITNINWLSLV